MKLDREVQVEQEVMFTDPVTGMTFVGVVVYMPEFEKPDTVLVRLEDNIILSCARSTVQPFPYTFDKNGFRYPMQPNSLLLAFKDTNDQTTPSIFDSRLRSKQLLRQEAYRSRWYSSGQAINDVHALCSSEQGTMHERLQPHS